jgi:cell division protein FtsI (penicillin-binding protein 3)
VREIGARRLDFYQTPSIRIRLSLVISAFALISVGMLARSTWIQIIHDPKLENLANKQFQSKILMKPRRGLITDRTGEPLAINLETSSLAGNPSKILKTPSTLHLLAHAMGVTPAVLKKRLDSKKSFFWAERHLTDDRMERFKRLGIVQVNGDMPEGLWIVKEMKRVYPHGDLATALLGGVNVDTEGLEGVELWKNSSLRGKSASFDAYKDALGRPALIRNDANTQTTDGQNIELSIDASLQYSAEEALQEGMEKTSSDSGLVAVMDSNTGEILALAQSPLSKKVKKVTALTDGYEPGSTMKPLMIASAINKGVSKITDTVFGHYGKMVIQGHSISEAEVHEKFGYITLKKVIEVSSNVGAAEEALKFGADRYVASLRELGFGQRTGVAFPGEISGWMPTQAQAKNVKPLSLANMGFGQGIMVTPLQMLRAYAALSNGGNLVEPTLLKRIDGEPQKRIPVLKAQAVRDVTDALVSVTEGEKGTGHKAQVEGFRIAGKTGTAQQVDPHTHKYSSTNYDASFIGFPVGVKQPVTVLVIFNHPRSALHHGGDTAAPVFSKVMKQVTSRFSIPTTEKVYIPLVEATPVPSKHDSAHAEDTIQIAQSSAEVTANSVESAKEVNLDHPIMPSLLGLTPQEAMRSLRPFAPAVQIKGFGLIRKQIPESGAMISQNQRVTLILEE